MNIIYRAPKDAQHPFVMVLRDTLYDQRLSLKAKGLLCFILSKSDGWHINIRGLATELKESKNAIAGVLNELIEHRYCIRGERERGPDGLFLSYNYIVFESAEERKKWEKKHGSSPSKRVSRLLDLLVSSSFLILVGA